MPFSKSGGKWICRLYGGRIELAYCPGGLLSLPLRVN